MKTISIEIEVTNSQYNAMQAIAEQERKFTVESMLISDLQKRAIDSYYEVLRLSHILEEFKSVEKLNEENKDDEDEERDEEEDEEDDEDEESEGEVRPGESMTDFYIRLLREKEYKELPPLNPIPPESETGVVNMAPFRFLLSDSTQDSYEKIRYITSIIKRKTFYQKCSILRYYGIGLKKEQRSNKFYVYGQKKINNKFYKFYVGRDRENEVLEDNL